jgi:hypothetical protein
MTAISQALSRADPLTKLALYCGAGVFVLPLLLICGLARVVLDRMPKTERHAAR